MTAPDHCWHDTGTVAESDPPKFEQRCCACGEERWFTRARGLPEGPAHGTIAPLCAGRGNGGELLLRPFRPEDVPAVVALWERCGLTRPWNDPHKDIDRKLRVQADLFLVGVVGGEIRASVMAGYDGHRGWVNYLAVDPAHRRRGYGRQAMEEVERKLRELGCPKINLQVREANRQAIAFYEGIGFAVDPVVSLGKRLEPDDAG